MVDCDNVPLFPLQTVLFPGMTLPLHIFEERYRIMIDRCQTAKSPFGVVMITDGSDVDTGDGPPSISRVGCFAKIVRSEKLEDGRFYIEVSGDNRFRIDETFENEPYMTGRVTPIKDDIADVDALGPVFRNVTDQFRAYVAQLMARMNRTVSTIHLPGDPTMLSFAVAGAMDIPLPEKQLLLETPTTRERLELEACLLARDNARAEAEPEEIKIGQAEPVKITQLRVSDLADKISRN